MSFWIARAVARDHYYAEKEGIYANSGCGAFLLKVIFIVCVVAVCYKLGIVTE